jgi:hypothetical protein
MRLEQRVDPLHQERITRGGFPDKIGPPAVFVVFHGFEENPCRFGFTRGHWSDPGTSGVAQDNAKNGRIQCRRARVFF